MTDKKADERSGRNVKGKKMPFGAKGSAAGIFRSVQAEPEGQQKGVGRSLEPQMEDRGKGNVHNRDINSKTVFRDPVLCAQFLRDNLDIPELKYVRSEDIEDISERYLPYLGTQFDADSVNKIRILDIGGENEGEEENKPPFFVSLIDHKSLVDYDVPMQLLRYMVGIWHEYRREMEIKKEGCTRQKGFRYPVIIPIVYYEGRERWGADRHLGDRIGNDTGCREWIPDFKYELVRIHDYSNEELLARGDEMSLIMLFNKVQDASGLEEFLHIPPEKLDWIVRDSPGHVLDVIASVMESLCFKIGASEEERTECVRKVRERNMGYLFENAEHMSLEEERRKTKEERERAEAEHQRAEEESRKAEAEHQRAEEESRKAEAEHQRAEEESRKAEVEHQRAEAERQRAEEMEEKLRIAEEKIRILTARSE